MISFRGIWIIQRKRSDFIDRVETSTSQSEFYDYSVIFSKQFPTVNQRLKSLQQERYSNLPKDNEMCDYLKQAIEFSTHISHEVKTEDTVIISPDAPMIFTLSFLGKDPISCVYSVKNNSTFFITIPAVLSPSEQRHYIKQKNILMGISFLEGIEKLCGKFFDSEKKRTKEEYNQALNYELARKLQISCPYGTPIESLDSEWIKSLIKLEDKTKKTNKNNSSINRRFNISELLLYSNEENTQDGNLSIIGFKGVVQAELNLQGAPEMSLGFCIGKEGNVNLDQVIQNLSLYYSAIPTSTIENFATDIKISPPNYPFNLCYYNVNPELSISNTKTIQQLFTASYIIDYDHSVFKIQIIIDVDPVFTRLKYDVVSIEIPLYGVKLDSITNYSPANQMFTQPEKINDHLLTKIIKFDENNRAIIAFQFTAEINEEVTEYLRIRKPSFISDIQNTFKPHIIIKTKLQSSLSGFNIDTRKITVVGTKTPYQFSIQQETAIEAVIFARHLYGEINQ
ncbi:hypothetical protein ENU1_005150 [Entamoeba nuttalli P19]|uniref:MHD domain-containing protein n=1 Tax=Entamoeba nuttalli (strain P19) TaxID=1076696 RepID=K2GJE8_ENTNP|nr:hypothetical protein ENU1_005150 [Entamoeba nuttalli P19]EKE42911.1 hypothetical protein ENU1_005150 [Entamoeba nuttalli P19]|eukprot:XP_008854756.1 hypothetical protein ENU1_005150 [Entamoeba nuttalli P19]